MSISYEGIGQNCVTLKRKNAVEAGYVCKTYTSDIIDVCGSDDTMLGVVAAVRGEYATVIISGVVTVPYSGTTPTIGACALSGDGSGKVTCNPAGTKHRVLRVNAMDKTVTFIL